jgi:cell division septation protein DedD
MDRRVKERLVGASILALLIVLIVPELLSGPAPSRSTPKLPVSAPEPIRNITVDLATSKATVPGLETGSAPPRDGLDAAASAAARPAAGAAGGAAAGEANSAASGSAANAGASAAAGRSSLPSSSAPPADTSIPLESSATSPTSVAGAKAGGHAWSVQLGSFASRANAEKLLHQLKGQGFAAYVLPGGSGSSARYRVRIGPMADHGTASQAVIKLKSLGHPASIVPPAG